jgi:hypothetical protein
MEDDPGRGLGRALAWADGHGVPDLHLLVEAEAGVLARRAAFFDRPPVVWTIEGRELWPPAPVPHRAPAHVALEVEPLRDIIEWAGAEVVEEHGALSGEVAGLEVCRAVVADDGSSRLDVGIGPHDREAFRLVHPDEAVGPALAELVRLVAGHRRPGAAPHALNRIARERYLRWRLVRDPSLIGLDELQLAPPPVPRRSLKESGPCVAVGSGPGAFPVVVVSSVGVDLDVVPFAADARDALAGPGDRLVIVVPVADDLPITRTLAARLTAPAEVVTVPVEPPSP